MTAEEAELRNIYGQVLLGISPISIDNIGGFIKHFGPIDQSELDSEYINFFDSAVRQELPTEEQKLAQLKSDLLWLDEDEKQVEIDKQYLSNLLDTKKNLALPSQVESVNKDIQEVETKLSKKLEERENLIGLTAEIFARKKLNQLYIFKSLYKDKEARLSYFSDDEYDYLDPNEVNSIVGKFNIIVNKLRPENLKKIALNYFFQNHFSLCDDNIYHFYGKPIIYLSFYQSELAGYGRFFKYILNLNPKPPQELINDPEKLLDWYNASQSASKMMSSQTSENVAIIGTQQDVESLKTADSEVVSIQSLAKGKTRMRGAELAKILKNN